MNLLLSRSPILAELGVMYFWNRLDAGLREKLAVLTAMGVLTLLLLVWAVYFRKRRRRRSRHASPAPATRLRSEKSYGHAGGHRRRRRHREHRPRNPTRAETGGLPPVRTQEPQETTV